MWYKETLYKNKVRIIVESSENSTDDDSYRVASMKRSKKCRSHVTVEVENHPVRFQVDSGADVNIFDDLNHV